MATRKRKEPIIVLIIFLLLMIGLIVAFVIKGNYSALEKQDWKQLAIFGGILFFIYIMYVELRGKRAAQVLVEEKVKTHTLVDALPQAVVVVDGERRIITANKPACQILRADPIEIVGKPSGDLFDADTVTAIGSSTGGKFDGQTANKERKLRVTVAQMQGEAGKLVILEPVGAPAIVHDKPSGYKIVPPRVPAIWDRMGELEKHFQSMQDDTRRAMTHMIVRARKMLNRPEEVEGVPEKIEKSEADIGALAKEAVAKVRPVAWGKKVSLDVASEGDGKAKVDRDLVLRAFEEIFLNALTYTSEGGTVKVEVEGTDKEVSLRVTDSGIGIPHEEFAQIFDLGFVGSQQVPEGEGGGGIGLAVARKVIESHGGTIWVESESGRGTRISLNLPRG